MKLSELEKNLLAAARTNPPDGRVPYAFEKRLMARLAARPRPDNLLLWSRDLWRAALACAALVLLIGLSTFHLPPDNPAGSPAAGTELSQDFQDTLLAAVDVTEPNDLAEPDEFELTEDL